ncbi:ribose ABC transporter permease [Spirochaetia bacterium]|nr:ribose ABC transporter permease [Spirochaetia bacterium]
MFIKNEGFGKLLKENFASQMINRYILILLLIVELFVFSRISEYFFTMRNLFSTGLNTSVLGIVAIGQTLCILTSDFDLSVGNTAAFTGIMSAWFFHHTNGNLGLSIGLALLAALCIGLVNGLLITKARISAFITTMATNFIIGGVIILITHGQAIIVSNKAFGFLGKTTLTGIKIPLPMVIFVLLYIIFAWILKNTVFGRQLYCVGGNKQAAIISGININRVKIVTFMTSSLMAGFAGIILAARMSAGQITVGSNYPMESIAATVLGGTILAGGSGNIIGTFFGVLVTGILSNGLTMVGVSQAWRDIATGLLLVLAIVLQNTMTKSTKN